MTLSSPKFSLIVPHYDGSISDELFERGIQSLLDQTYQDFEVLIYHDGPIQRPVPDIWKQFSDRAKLTITKKRENNWGHGNRDRGIKEALGEYIVHFNPDNILYPNALEEIVKEINRADYPIEISNKIIVFPVIMRGVQCGGWSLWRDQENATTKAHIITGYPPVKNNIDAMQVVMHNQLWYKYGGWFDKTEQSDGNMYPVFIQENNARYCSNILGEHW